MQEKDDCDVRTYYNGHKALHIEEQMRSSESKTSGDFLFNKIWIRSSMVEHSAVNRGVVGSSPTVSAKQSESGTQIYKKGTLKNEQTI